MMKESVATKKPSNHGAPDQSASSIRARYDGASGEPVDAAAIEITNDGVFVVTDRPLPIGKRISVEIQLASEQISMTAAARVIEKRGMADALGRPAGMRMKFISIEDGALASIQRLAEAEEASTGRARQRTQLGVAPAAPLAMLPADRRALSEPLFPGPESTVSAVVAPVVAPVIEEIAAPVASPESEVRPMVVAVSAPEAAPPPEAPAPRMPTLEAFAVAPAPPEEMPQFRPSRAKRVIVAALVAAGIAGAIVGYRGFRSSIASTTSASVAGPPAAAADPRPASPPVEQAPASPPAPVVTTEPAAVSPPASAAPSTHRSPSRPHRGAPRKSAPTKRTH
jgi:DNA polymerase-3 subunit gamma/tau